MAQLNERLNLQYNNLTKLVLTLSSVRASTITTLSVTSQTSLRLSPSS